MERWRRVRVTKVTKLIVLGLVVVAVFFIAKGILSLTTFMRETGVTPGLVTQLLVDDGAPLKSFDGRTNLLLLGIGGGNHAGADLTDTMMIISLHQSNKSMAFISIPRDLWSETLKDKINSAYHYGEEKKQGGGTLLTKVIVEDVVGLPIHYTILVDFSGFQEIIDRLGGIDVNVSRGFTDTEFPIAGKENDECDGDPLLRCRYETIHFDAGVQHMNGESALKYIRSRHAEGEEGGDFARSRRQQEVLLALKEKATHPAEWFSSASVSAFARVVDDAIDTDMNIGELLSFGKRFSQIDEGSITRISIESQLYEPPISWYGRYVLIPKEDFAAIHAYIRGQLK